MTEHRWPPQPGDLVKVERSTLSPTHITLAMVGKVCEFKRNLTGWCEVWNSDRSDYWLFNLSDLSPATLPQTIEHLGRTYRLDEGWQPIATAPRGAKEIAWMLLAWNDAGEWHSASGMYCRGKFYAASAFHLGRDTPYEFRQHEVKPSHWMPMPEPPATTEPTP